MSGGPVITGVLAQRQEEFLGSHRAREAADGKDFADCFGGEYGVGRVLVTPGVL